MFWFPNRTTLPDPIRVNIMHSIQTSGKFNQWNNIYTEWGAGMAQWWERSPSTNVSRVRFTDPASYVGSVCWFSTLLREVFSG